MPNYLAPGVYVQEMESDSRPIEGVGTAVAAFVGLAPEGPENTPTLVTTWKQFESAFGGLTPGAYLAQSVYGYFMNGGGAAYIVRVGTTPALEKPAAKGAKVAPPPPPQISIGKYVFTAKGPAAAAGAKPVKVEIADAGGENPPGDQLKVVVMMEGRQPEIWENVSSTPGAEFFVTKVSTESKLVTVSEAPVPGATKPVKGTYELVLAVAPTTTPVVDKLSANDYIGDPADRTGFGGLEAIDDVTIVAVPDLVAALEQGAIDLDGFKAVQLAMIAHCESMGDRIAVLDPPPGLSVQAVKDWRTTTAGYDSRFAALYYPYIKVMDVTGTPRLIPPSGYIAGVWARSDATRGVHKAPANEVIKGVLGLETTITSTEQELLNPEGINALRSFPGRGVRVWGARTLSSDPAWRYLNVRRLFNFLEQSILGGTQFAVFEPNDPQLWARLGRTIDAFLKTQWRQGALFGRVAEQAYYVKCDEETNPPELVDIGQVVVQIGVAPVKPAEFVVFQLSQFSGGGTQVAE